MRAAPSQAGMRDDDLGPLIGQARRLVWRAAAGALEPLGESMLAWQVLRRLEQGGARTQRELADATAQHPAGLSRLLADLERRRLVRRKRDRADRRRVLVEATAAGRAWRAARAAVVHRAIDAATAVLDARERATLARLLRKLTAADGER